jgi:hypothetical protein
LIVNETFLFVKDIKDEKNTTTYGEEYDASDESTDNISKRDKKHRKNKNRSSKDPSESRNSDFAGITFHSIVLNGNVLDCRKRLT